MTRAATIPAERHLSYRQRRQLLRDFESMGHHPVLLLPSPSAHLKYGCCPVWTDLLKNPLQLRQTRAPKYACLPVGLPQTGQKRDEGDGEDEDGEEDDDGEEEEEDSLQLSPSDSVVEGDGVRNQEELERPSSSPRSRSISSDTASTSSSSWS